MRSQLALVLTAALSVASCAARAGFVDPLDAPALESSLARSSMLQSVVRAGERLVAVGQRGHIVYSDDDQWRQAQVPIAADLTAVHFPTVEKGWVVGHGGVVLHSRDGGRHWVKQLDGKQAADIALAYYEKRAHVDADAAKMLQEARRLAAEGADKPFLDVWFENERVGYVVGAFNLIFKTGDGGRSWEPWLHRVDNPKGYHLYAIRGRGTALYIAGEQGLVLRLDTVRQRFVNVATPYQGSYFGLLVTPNILLVYGLSGNAYHSRDGGRNWSRSDTGVASGITGGAVLDDGRIVLITQTGQMMVSRNDGAGFASVSISLPGSFHGVAPAGPGSVALAGSRGMQIEFIR